MNGKTFFVMRWVAIFVIFVGAAGLFSSIWSGISDTIFYNGSLVPATQCHKYTNAGTPSETVESVNSFVVNTNGTRYDCYSTSQTYPQFQNLQYQIPGIFTFGLIISFGALMYRYASKQQREESVK